MKLWGQHFRIGSVALFAHATSDVIAICVFALRMEPSTFLQNKITAIPFFLTGANLHFLVLRDSETHEWHSHLPGDHWGSRRMKSSSRAEAAVIEVISNEVRSR